MHVLLGEVRKPQQHRLHGLRVLNGILLQRGVMLDAEQKRLAADGLLLGRCVIRHDRPYLRLIGGPLCFTGGSRLRLCGSAGLPGAARLACDFLGRRHGSCFVRCLRPLRCVFIHPDFTAGCKAQLIRSGITHRFRFLLRRIDLPHR